MTLTEFLTARLDEDEAVARAWVDGFEPFGPETDYLGRFNPAYILAGVAAKRAIVEEIEDQRDFTYATEWDKRQTDRHLDTLLRLLAQPYAAHPDFDPEWRV